MLIASLVEEARTRRHGRRAVVLESVLKEVST